MAFSHAAGHGVAALATSWSVYAVAVAGAGTVLLTQTAYQTGRPILTLPIIAAVTPIASVAVGVGLLGETPRIGVAGMVAAGLAVVVTGLALARLAYSAPHPEVAHPEIAAEVPDAGSCTAPSPLTPRARVIGCRQRARSRRRPSAATPAR